MKHGVLLLTLVLLSFVPVYAQATQYENNEQSPQLYTSEQIQAKFGADVTEGNYSEVIAAILEWMNRVSGEEEYTADVVTESLKEMAVRLPEPARGLIHYILADFYYNYWKNNRWRINRRTSAPEAEGGIASWDLNRLFGEALKYYDLAIAEENILKKTPIRDYDRILHYSSIPKDISDQRAFSSRFFPTLYDFLVFNAIKAFAGELSVSISQQPFIIDLPEYYSDADVFVNLDITLPEDPSVEYKVLTLYQELLAFRLQEFRQNKTGENLLPLLFMDIERLGYIRSKGVYSNIGAIYQQELLRLEEEYNSYPESAYTLYKLAESYEKEGQTWNPNRKNNVVRNKLIEARDLSIQVIEKWPEFAPYPQLLIEKIEIPLIQIATAKEHYPSDPILAFAKCRNVDSIYFRVYKAADYQGSEKWDYATFARVNAPVLEHVVSFSLPKDHQVHSAQIMIDGLPQGKYVLFASQMPFTANSHLNKKQLLAKSSFQVSALAALFRGGYNETFRFPKMQNEGFRQLHILERKTGKSIAGANVECFIVNTSAPRDQNGKYPQQRAGNYTTDNDGMAYIPILKHQTLNKFIVRTSDGRRLDLEEELYIYLPERDTEDTEPEAVFFTDRSIYRPGQTVYYKALLIQADEEGKKHLVTGQEMEVGFHDVNDNEIGTHTLVTNEYGSVHGSFVIPQGLLNGRMWIESEYGVIAVRVEEYKRPTFEVEFEPVTKTHRLDEEITVNGKVNTLAGYPVNHSTVNYQVTRTWNGRLSRSNPNFAYLSASVFREIASGQAETNERGEFRIHFTTAADDISNKDLVFDYEVQADVTDVNGETRSANLTVIAGNKPLLVETTLPEILNDRKALNFRVTATNLNRQPVAADLSVTVTSLAGPNRVLRSRLWNKPDTTLIPKDTFIELFPNDIYLDEDDPKTYTPLREVHTAHFSTVSDPEGTPLDLSSLSRKPGGWYQVEIRARNNDGVEAEKVQYVHLSGDASARNASPIPHVDQWVTIVKDSGEPGDQAVFQLSGPRKNSWIRYDVFSNEKIVESHSVEVGPVPREITVPIKEEYKNDLGVVFLMIRDGRSYTRNVKITVSPEEKDLDVKFTTFRSELLPGEQEKWTLTVKNKKGEKEAAEMVATLYDASLDAFRPLYWPDKGDLTPYNYSWLPGWKAGNMNSPVYSGDGQFWRYISPTPPSVNMLITHRKLLQNNGRAEGKTEKTDRQQALQIADPDFRIAAEKKIPKEGEIEAALIVEFGEQKERSVTGSVSAVSGGDLGASLAALKEAANFYDNSFNADEIVAFTFSSEVNHEKIALRHNFNETAFFYPQLRTDENGEITIEFTIPEALTRWKMLGFAHTKDLKTGGVSNTLITRKQVAVSANAPRFFREGDLVEFTAKVSNITSANLSGQALLRLYDAATLQPLDSVLQSPATTDFNAAAGQSTGLRWTMTVPGGVSAITYRLTAQAGQHTDGEERTVPVMTNSVLVTETLPFHVRAGERKEVEFDRLKENASHVQRNHSLTLEFTSNPAWYAIQSIPYLMEYPYECAEQVFSRFYANSLAAALVNSSPRIKQVFEQWREMPNGQNALLSNLEKNQELKQVLLEETPWAMQAQDESERKKRIGLLFDLNRMHAEQRGNFEKLKNIQNNDGGFPWFSGLLPNRFITQHIMAGLGHLERLHALNAAFSDETMEMMAEGFSYLDLDLVIDYRKEKQAENFDPVKKQCISYIQLHYLYAASFTSHRPEEADRREAFDFYYEQAKKYWNNFGLYGQGLAALAFHRYGDTELAKRVIATLKSTSRRTEDMGMFWRENRSGYFWYEAPIETQALMIEAFHEVAGDTESVEEMKIWLLRNKQTNDWVTTKATAEACYALLMTGSNLLAENRTLEVRVGGKPLSEAAQGDIRPEAGSGYVKTSWSGSDITPGMSSMEVVNPNRSGMAWGGIYWQYFEHIDQVTGTETDLGLQKELFIKKNTSRGPELVKVEEGTTVRVGDLLTVRLVLRAHRDYEYVHLKDMRASAFEPEKAISGYRYQDGLRYYENIKDASTNFFITHLSSGTYVFEYDLRVTHEGEFSNGITTFQCMYAPEYSAHSGGMRIKVE